MSDFLAELEALGYSPDEVAEAIEVMPDIVAEALLPVVAPKKEKPAPPSPLDQALELSSDYRVRPHLKYLSDRLVEAEARLGRGESSYLVVSMPPRMGKSRLVSVESPLWFLRRDPKRKIGMISHDQGLAIQWARTIRRTIEDRGDDLGLAIAKDAGAVAEWETSEGGSVLSRSTGQSVTGRGFNVMIIDDPVKDYAAAHSDTQMEALWSWMIANAISRMEAPYIILVVGTRWHEKDFIGRLLDPAVNADAARWENIVFPAIAEDSDVLGRLPGEPLLSPLVPDESPSEALERWSVLEQQVGGYNWAGLYQQRPAPAKGAIFTASKWRFWTTDPRKVTDDHSVIYLDPYDDRQGPHGETITDDSAEVTRRAGQWLDSWDMAFKGSETSDYVVGQRWMMRGPYRYLIDQVRGRMSFTETIQAVKDFKAGPYGHLVHRILIESAANGEAAMDTLKKSISGIEPVRAKDSKELRARVVTPEHESGHVLLPHPTDPGNSWVNDLISELTNFPRGAHDDQVDALTQALMKLRREVQGSGGISLPSGRVASSLAAKAAPRGGIGSLGGTRLPNRRIR